jgi:hypothetical protein
VYPNRVQPVNLQTPTAALLTQAMRCLATGKCVPRTIWIGCPWHCDLPPVSVIRAWRARFRLDLPPIGLALRPGATRGSATISRSSTDDGPPPGSAVELRLEWSGDRRTEVIRIYEVNWADPPPVIIAGAIFDELI